MLPGMAYVMLGRCEDVNDVYICGPFDIKGIKLKKNIEIIWLYILFVVNMFGW